MPSKGAASSSQGSGNGVHQQNHPELNSVPYYKPWLFTCWHCDKVFADLQGLDKHHYEHQGSSGIAAITEFEAKMIRYKEGRELFLGGYLAMAPSTALLLQPSLPPSFQPWIVANGRIVDGLVLNQVLGRMELDQIVEYERSCTTKNYLDQLERTLKEALTRDISYDDGDVDSNALDLTLKM